MKHHSYGGGYSFGEHYGSDLSSEKDGNDENGIYMEETTSEQPNENGLENGGEKRNEGHDLR